MRHGRKFSDVAESAASCMAGDRRADAAGGRLLPGGGTGQHSLFIALILFGFVI